jgi:hypothetical protein
VGCARAASSSHTRRTSIRPRLLASQGARRIIRAWPAHLGLARSLARGVFGSPSLSPVWPGPTCPPGLMVMVRRIVTPTAPASRRESRHRAVRIAHQSATLAWINAAVARRRPLSLEPSPFPPVPRVVPSSGRTPMQSSHGSGGLIPNRSRTVLPARPSSQHRA